MNDPNRHGSARFRRVLLGVFLLTTAACGYRLKGELSPPAGVRRIAVPTFANRTYEPGLELPFTERLRNEFVRGRGMALSLDRAQADAVLAGEVLSFRAVPTVLVKPAGFPEDRRLPTRYRAVVEVRIALLSVATGEVLWEDRLEGTEEYDAGAAPEGFEPLARESQQQQAIASLAEDLMREAYDRMMSDF